MSAGRKTRSDARLLSLTEAQQEKIATWLTIENRSYDEVRSMIAVEFGVKTSVGALHNFYTSVAAPWKYARAAGEADSWAELMDGKFDQATIKRVRQLAFEAMSTPQPDLKVVKALMKISGDAAKLSLAQERLGLDARKVVILEAKAALADKATEIANDKNLTEEEQAAGMRALFGMG